MIQTVNEYTQGLHLPNYKPQDYDPTLEVQVALYNQKNYDRVLQTVKGLQSQALNIQMLNQEGRERLDQYNRELNQSLSGDLGDLTKVEVQNEIANMFQKIAGDTQLAKASQLSADYQDQLNTIESFRQSGRKDKGYNLINETVFKEWDGGLYDFAKSSLNKVTDNNFQPIKYTPFKELDIKLLNIAKVLHVDTQITEGASGSEGYLVHKEMTQVTPEKVRSLIQSQFDQEDLEQLDVMAKYEVIQNRRMNSIPDFYRKYEQYADNEISRTQAQSDILKQQADYYIGLINSKDTPDEKKAEYTNLVNELNTQSGLYANRATSLIQSKKQLSDFEKLSNPELLKYAQEMQWFSKINNLADALSWKKEVEMYKPDQVWMFNKKMDVTKWQEQIRATTKLTLKRMDGAKENRPEFSGQIDAVKNPLTFVDSYSTLVSMQESVAKKSNRIITSPSFNPNNLLDENWIRQNKDNYEVRMWDIFSKTNQAIKGNKPQLETFKLWLKDQESNPKGMTNSLVSQQQRDEIVSNYLDTELMKINQATQSQINEFDFLEGYPIYNSQGQRISREQYLGGETPYIGVPTGDGFKLMTVNQAMGEAGNYSDNYSTGIPMLPGKRIQTDVINDRGLYQRLLDLRNKKRDINSQLESEMISRLPQIFQTGVVDAMNEEAMKIYWPEVASTAKNANEDAQFAIDFEDVAFIRPPVSGNKGQFQLKNNLSKDYSEMGWKLPDAADPTKLVPIVPGGSYSFTTNKPYMPYDVLLNEAAKTNPIQFGYKGYSIEMSKSEINPGTFVKITDSTGQTIKSGQSQIEDVNQVLMSMHQYIDALK